MLGTFGKGITSRLDLSSSTWHMSTWWNPESGKARYALIRLLAFAHRERLDVLPLVRHLAAEQRGAARRRLRRLERRLALDTPLIEALEQTPDLLSDEDLLALRFGNQSGTLMATFEFLLERNSAQNQAAWIRVIQAIAYGICLAVFTSLALAFLMVFIAPTFKRMFEDFGLRLPSALQALIVSVDNCVQYLPIVILLMVVGVVTILFAKPQQWFRRVWLSKIWAPVANLRTAHLQHLLAISSDAGRPLSASLSTLARYHFDNNIRLKLLEARNNVEQGTTPWLSLAEVQLLSSGEANSLEHAESPEFRSWLLRQLATWREEKVTQWAGYIGMLLYPAIVVTFGLLVLWIVVAFMSVVITMISALA